LNWDLLDWSIVGPALVAGLLVLSTHVPLGQVVLQRGIIFIDLAIAQVAALGVIAAGFMDWEENIYAVQAVAVGSALVAAAALNWTERRWPEIQEALIGTLFILAASGSVLLLAENPHGGEYLKDLLVGQILWTTWHKLIPVSLLYAVLLLLWFAGRERLGRPMFYATFAFAITASVQLVGIYLVFASLILPALGLPDRSCGVPVRHRALGSARPADRGGDRLDDGRGGAARRGSHQAPHRSARRASAERLLLTKRPGVAPVCSPFSSTGTPLTST
jgi:zinc/manganese transport system permease protein